MTTAYGGVSYTNSSQPGQMFSSRYDRTKKRSLFAINGARRPPLVDGLSNKESLSRNKLSLTGQSTCGKKARHSNDEVPNLSLNSGDSFTHFSTGNNRRMYKSVTAGNDRRSVHNKDTPPPLTSRSNTLVDFHKLPSYSWVKADQRHKQNPVKPDVLYRNTYNNTDWKRSMTAFSDSQRPRRIRTTRRTGSRTLVEPTMMTSDADNYTDINLNSERLLHRLQQMKQIEKQTSPRGTFTDVSGRPSTVSVLWGEGFLFSELKDCITFLRSSNIVEDANDKSPNLSQDSNNDNDSQNNSTRDYLPSISPSGHKHDIKSLNSEAGKTTTDMLSQSLSHQKNHLNNSPAPKSGGRRPVQNQPPTEMRIMSLSRPSTRPQTQGSNGFLEEIPDWARNEMGEGGDFEGMDEDFEDLMTRFATPPNPHPSPRRETLTIDLPVMPLDANHTNC